MFHHKLQLVALLRGIAGIIHSHVFRIAFDLAALWKPELGPQAARQAALHEEAGYGTWSNEDIGWFRHIEK